MIRVILSKSAQKNYEHLPKNQQAKVKKKLLVLQENPYSGKKLAGNLTGYHSLRAWPYRIIYIINEQKRRVEVSNILHRQGAYR